MTGDAVAGVVRMLAGRPPGDADRIAVYVGGTEHRMPVEKALDLANRIILTCVDGQERSPGWHGEGT